ncbi:MAG: cytosine permease [Candidatus Latescibacteria bacterium]|nr:cytosine permease [Candidatus Latescibacterota bacterium]
MAELVEKRSVDRIPDGERTTGFWALFMLWVGFSISVARLWQGGIITGAGFWKAILALFIAQVFWIYIAIGAVMGAAEGLPGTMIMRSAFGVRGRVIPSVPLIIGTIGWFGLQLGITASALEILIKSLYGEWSVPIQVQYVIWGILMGMVSIYGYKVVMWFQKFVSPLLLLLIPWMIYKMFNRYDVLAELSRPKEVTMGFFEAVTILSGGVLAMLIAAADSSRYARSRTVAFGSFMVATWFVGTVMFVIGMMGTVIVGVADPASIVDRLGLGLLGLLIVVLSAWSTNCMNPYWGGIALSTLTTGNKWLPQGIPRVISTLFVVAVGTITAVMGIYSIGGIKTFVNVLAGTLGPANGIIIADYFFLRGKGKNKLDADELVKVNGKYWYSGGWNLIALVVWIIGVAYSMIFKNTYILITPVSTQIISGILYYVLMKTAGKKYL